MPGWVMTTEGEIKVMSVSEAAQFLGCEVADIFRWFSLDLIDVVSTPKGEILPFYEDMAWLRKEGEKYSDWPYDRILWRRYEREAVMRCSQERSEEVVDAALASTSWVDETVVEDVVQMAQARTQTRPTMRKSKPLPPMSKMREQKAARRVF